MGESSNLVILALVMSALSLMLSSVSAWPSWKDSLATVRDAILWIALIFVLVGIANYHWRSRNWDAERGAVHTGTKMASPLSLDTEARRATP